MSEQDFGAGMENVTPIRSSDSAARLAPVPDTKSRQPCNIEAEQALLGAILVNNDVYAPVTEIIEGSHFFDPVHRSIFELLAERISRNSIATPVSLKAFEEGIPGLSELGGAEYLFKLADSAVSIHASKDFAREIYDLARRRNLIALGMNLTDQARTVDAKVPVDDIIEQSEKQLYELNESGRLRTGFQTFLESTKSAVEDAKNAASRHSKLAGLSTGLTDLDHRLGGLNRSDLIIVAGRPSMGKTALATNIAFNVAKNFNKFGRTGDADTADGGHVGMFSLEMSASQLAARILSVSSNITTSQLRRGQLSRDDFFRYAEAARQLQSLPLFIDDTPALTIAQLATRARRLKETHDLHLLVVDYLQLVRPTSERNSVVHEVSEISRGLKAIAKHLDIPVIAVSQLSRQVEQRDDKRPQLADLRDSGSIEQDADVVMFVFRQAYYDERKKPEESEDAAMHEWRVKMEEISRKAEVIIGKQRHGPIGTVELSFDAQFTLFGNKAEEGYADPGASSSHFAH